MRTRAAALVAATAFGLGLLTAGTAHAAPAASAAPKPAVAAAAVAKTVITGTTIRHQNEYWASPDGSTKLYMQWDGNVVVYKNGTAVWSAPGAMPNGNFLAMQVDGNLVVYSASNTPLWASNTGGHYGAVLAVYDSGAIQVEQPDGTVLWTSVPPRQPCPITVYQGQWYPWYCNPIILPWPS
ncbi:hypothetical protein ABT095_17485 [Kitasatospora sp. NPDC002227]|uniref:hypothetical protein n=1 Tax=Kitasatospora sp. NPDC002227 TaxID=3154773 RepID=UPI003316B5F1